MNAIRRLWQRGWHRRGIATPVAELRELVIADPASDILRHLEVVLKRALKRQVFVCRVESDAPKASSSIGPRAGTWITGHSAVNGWLRAAAERGLTDNVHPGIRRIEALVPIVRESDAVVAMVGIGGRPLRRLSTRECSLVDAAVGMAVLLMQQAELRRQVQTAESLSGVVQRMAEVQRLQRGIKSYLDSSRN